MGTAMDILVNITATSMDTPNAVTGIKDTTGAMLTTGMAHTSMVTGPAAKATRVISADKSVTTIARI